MGGRGGCSSPSRRLRLAPFIYLVRMKSPPLGCGGRRLPCECSATGIHNRGWAEAALGVRARASAPSPQPRAPLLFPSSQRRSPPGSLSPGAAAAPAPSASGLVPLPERRPGVGCWAAEEQVQRAAQRAAAGRWCGAAGRQDGAPGGGPEPSPERRNVAGGAWMRTSAIEESARL